MMSKISLQTSSWVHLWFLQNTHNTVAHKWQRMFTHVAAKSWNSSQIYSTHSRTPLENNSNFDLFAIRANPCIFSDIFTAVYFFTISSLHSPLSFTLMFMNEMNKLFARELCSSDDVSDASKVKIISIACCSFMKKQRSETAWIVKCAENTQSERVMWESVGATVGGGGKWWIITEHLEIDDDCSVFRGARATSKYMQHDAARRDFHFFDR